MIKIPENVKFSVHGKTVSVEGPKGKLTREFPDIDLKFEHKDGSVIVKAPHLMVENSIESHIRNMLKGASEGYTKKMQLIFAHFPITIEIKGSAISIKNFQGEKKPRRAKIAGATKVEVKGQDITISGPNKEDVGQTVANLKSATKIRNRDSRVFQDGLYVVEE